MNFVTQLTRPTMIEPVVMTMAMAIVMADAVELPTNSQVVWDLCVYRWDCICVRVNTMSNSFLPIRNFESSINVRYFVCSWRCISIWERKEKGKMHAIEIWYTDSVTAKNNLRNKNGNLSDKYKYARKTNRMLGNRSKSTKFSENQPNKHKTK